MDTSIASSRPPGSFRVVRVWELTSIDELSTLRTSLHEELTGRPLAPDGALAEIPEKIVLVASELATNALRHGRPPTTVHLLSDGEEYIVDVVDQDTTSAPVVAAPRLPGDGGFGLVLAHRLALDVGWFVADGKHVWARLGHPRDAQAPPVATASAR
ncbi:ATP-binding protein [Oerskovia turbata]|jgi:serine/threonine-protein kinase RsbW